MFYTEQMDSTWDVKLHYSSKRWIYNIASKCQDMVKIIKLDYMYFWVPGLY